MIVLDLLRREARGQRQNGAVPLPLQGRDQCRGALNLLIDRSARIFYENHAVLMFSIVYFCCLRVVWRNKVNSFEIIVGTIMISAMDATDVEEH